MSQSRSGDALHKYMMSADNAYEMQPGQYNHSPVLDTSAGSASPESGRTNGQSQNMAKENSRSSARRKVQWVVTDEDDLNAHDHDRKLS